MTKTKITREDQHSHRFFFIKKDIKIDKFIMKLLKKKQKTQIIYI